MTWLRRLNEFHTRVKLFDDRVTANVIVWGHTPQGADPVVHRHNHFEVCLVQGENRGGYFAQEREWPVGPGDVVVARPNVPHQIRATDDGGLTLDWVAFNLETAPGTSLPDLLQVFVASRRVVSRDADNRLGLTWQVLRKTAAAGAMATVDHVAASLILTAAELLGGGAENFLPGQNPRSTRDSSFRLAVRYIHDNLYLPLRAEHVARHAGVSLRQLTRVFRRNTGKSFYQYLIDLRMEKARTLLRSKTLPIAEVGERVGYPDVHHFTRVFHARVGMPPAAYRASLAAAPDEPEPLDSLDKPPLQPGDEE